MPQLPAALVVTYEWQLHGLCRTSRTAMFGPEKETQGSKNRREIAAKQLCRPCPVRLDCLDHALAVGEPYGVWGGLGEARRHRRGVPARALP